MTPNIAPSPGRIVWYRPSSLEKIAGNDGSGQPLSAQVARVNDDGTLNLCVLDANALPTQRLNVLLVQPSAPVPDDSIAYAYWMPYQVGQAKKDEPIGERVGDALRHVRDEFNHAREQITEKVERNFEQRTYSDDTKASGPGPLPEKSPAQQDAAAAEQPAQPAAA